MGPTLKPTQATKGSARELRNAEKYLEQVTEPAEGVEALKKELAERALCQRKLIPFITRFDTAYLPGWVHQDIALRLERFSKAVAERKSPRLILQMPPRHGKSTLASHFFPAWHLGRYPDHEVITTSHTATLAEKFSRKIRELIRMKGYQTLFPNTQLDKNSQSVQQWNTTKGGGLLAAGVGGPILGSGAHCFPAGTLVYTPEGQVPIERLQPHMSVSTLNLRTGRTVAARIERVKSHVAQDRLVEVRTRSGRRIRATRDHCFYVAGVGWVEARHLEESDPLVVPAVSDALCAVRDRDGSASRGAAEDHQEGAQEPLLRQDVSGGVAAEGLALRGSTGPGGSEVPEREVLSGWVPLSEDGEATDAEIMSAVRDGVPAALAPDAVLFARLRQRSARGADGRLGELSFQRWHELRALVRHDEDAHLGAGWWLRGLRGRGEGPHSPHRSRPDEQPGGESDRALPRPPHDASQVAFDAVSVVCESGDGAERVYDLRVEGTHSFIAGEVLVHNCLIIDDPIKNAEEAQSEGTKESIWEWFATTAYTRLAPGGGVLIIMQRWDGMDLAGMLQKKAELGEGDQYEVVSYPALAEKDESYRREGEALHPDRYDEQRLAAIRKTLDEWMWSALFQQKPVREEGSYFSKEMVRYFDAKDQPPDEELTFYSTWDFAISQKQRADWTVGISAGVDKNGLIWIVDRVRDRMDSFQIAESILDMWEERPHDIMAGEQGQIKLALGPYLDREAEERGLWDFELTELSTGRRDKVQRARAIQGLMRRGKVMIPKNAAWTKQLVDELMAFPHGEHDDQVDALAYLGLLVQDLRFVERRSRSPRPDEQGWRKKLRELMGGSSSSKSFMGA